ncbi:Co2+/Mg2+ efflux protein ApaG [bacterium]|jgi:ApaG protein|nr:Co2+/Mg2+ efflux protein ApaG [bacterium]MBT4249300.1 Co2+/Mg2+ efflux protein ApaG [bacterium]MBT4927150.1 Co2+/Mg2+ efflux protein ApaG [bacterium]MBT5733627.1 Co2+/Mg2+ efflux protein ApaG [bacterium]MBT6019015.1 Co2+/Mg2+ efflux protein ApaG [bacterium]
MSIKNNNISIKVHSNFIRDRSFPQNSIFLFSYDVVIKNHNLFDVQLLSRYWHIQDGNGVVEEVRGPGVIGLKPVIKSDGTFKYSSFCPIKTPLGAMKGSYKMRSTKEEVFEAKIATFTLRANEYVN